LYKDGSGTLTLSADNSYSGDTRIVGGTLTVASGGDLGDGNSDVFISSGATLNVNANSTVDSVQETANSNGGVIAIGNGATLTVDGSNKGTLFQNSISGSGNLTVAAAGNTSLNLYGTQSYTGTTTVSGGKLSTAVALSTTGVTVSGGTIETTADNILNSSSKNVTVNSGTYDVKGSDTIGRLSGTSGTTAIASQKTLTANYGADASYGGTISGAGSFRKSGASTLTLASGASASVSTIAIQQGTLLLGAANQIGDSTAITLSGGTLNTAGYADATGKLTVSANSTIQGLNSTSGSAFTFSDIDLGNYSTASGSTLTLLPTSGTYSQGTVIQLSSVAASSWSGYSATSLNNFSSKISFSDANLMAQINFGGGTSGTTLTVAAIPEPRVYAAAAGLVLLIGWAEFKRRRGKKLGVSG
jgi:autotransporter-associated beta strand protein